MHPYELSTCQKHHRVEKLGLNYWIVFRFWGSIAPVLCHHHTRSSHFLHHPIQTQELTRYLYHEGYIERLQSCMWLCKSVLNRGDIVSCGRVYRVCVLWTWYKMEHSTWYCDTNVSFCHRAIYRDSFATMAYIVNSLMYVLMGVWLWLFRIERCCILVFMLDVHRINSMNQWLKKWNKRI